MTNYEKAIEYLKDLFERKEYGLSEEIEYRKLAVQALREKQKRERCTRWKKWIDDINVKGKPPNGNVPGMRRNYRDK